LSGATSVGVLGMTSTAVRLVADLAARGLHSFVKAIYQPLGKPSAAEFSVPVLPMNAMATARHDVIVVASDDQKEDLLEAAMPFISGTPKVIVSGYGHLRFRDSVFDDELAQLLVPSFANGYPNTLPHLYQCLANAARLGLEGVVAEFGMFKGGTTVFLSRLIERLGMHWPVIGFDTFDGFPARRSPLDMYDHPGCVFTDLDAVRRYAEGRRIEIVPGDVVQTCHRLDAESLVLTFIDTDNYTSARAVIEVVRDRTVLGGSIVFDHFTGVDRFRYTLGERIAGKVLQGDRRYFNLHGTGVFYRQR
jgi:O-methyltransferase